MALNNDTRFANPISDIDVVLQKIINQKQSVLDKNKGTNAFQIMQKPQDSYTPSDIGFIQSNPTLSSDIARLTALDKAANALQTQRNNLTQQYQDLYGSALESNKELVSKIQSLTSERLGGSASAQAAQQGAVQGLIGRGASAGQRIKAIQSIADKGLADRSKIISEGIQSEIAADPSKLIMDIGDRAREQDNFNIQLGIKKQQEAAALANTRKRSGSGSGTTIIQRPDGSGYTTYYPNGTSFFTATPKK